MLYGRGTTSGGYAGALGTPVITCASVSASVATTGSGTFALPTGVWSVVAAADAGDLLGTNGYQMHQGPVSTAASVYIGSTNEVIQVNITTDVAGALGYNLYAASVGGGNFYYQGRTGSNVGYIGATASGGNINYSGPYVTAGAGDQSAVATNFDGLLTNVAASGGYVKRLNATLSTTNPGTEFQNLFGALYEQVKADPDQVLINGFDRLQLSNAIFGSGTNPNAFRVYIENDSVGNVKAGAVVQSLLNQITGSEIPLMVHPWLPQGNALVRSTTLPIPDSNVSETSVMVLPQDSIYGSAA